MEVREVNMVKIQREEYLLILSDNPIDLFNHFNVKEMHGLYIDECEHIEGLCNYIPKENNKYELTDSYFVFINTSKHKDSIKLFALIMHEMMHMSFKKHSWDINQEEEIITWAEEESFNVYEQIKKINGTSN
jgi:hypothetical protein